MNFRMVLVSIKKMHINFKEQNIFLVNHSALILSIVKPGAAWSRQRTKFSLLCTNDGQNIQLELKRCAIFFIIRTRYVVALLSTIGNRALKLALEVRSSIYPYFRIHQLVLQVMAHKQVQGPGSSRKPAMPMIHLWNCVKEIMKTDTKYCSN